MEITMPNNECRNTSATFDTLEVEITDGHVTTVKIDGEDLKCVESLCIRQPSGGTPEITLTGDIALRVSKRKDDQHVSNQR